MKTLAFTGLSANNANTVNNLLSQLLADLQVHYTNLRNLHWNVKGHGFFILHEKYEELYNDVASKIDEVAERILQLDGQPDHRFSVYLQQSKVKELEVVETGKEGLGYVLESLKTLISDEREVLAAASEGGDRLPDERLSDLTREDRLDAHGFRYQSVELTTFLRGVEFTTPPRLQDKPDRDS